MSEIKNVNLSFSCPKTKDSLDKENGEYSCSDCSKPVIDFTNKTEAQLLQVLNDSSSRVCGIFKPSQLSKTFLKYLAATAIAGSTIVSTAHGQDIIELDSLEQTCEVMGDIVFGEYVEEGEPTSIYFPQPKGGIEKLYKALTNEIKYPDSLELDGRMFLQLTVDTLGQVTTIKVIKGFNEVAEKEAIRALRTIKFPFEPAEQNGAPIESKFVTTVTFKKD
ncbi:MAG: energy transducer TonB [bacterium]|nr:energy transducer TonB [bacterium]